MKTDRFVKIKRRVKTMKERMTKHTGYVCEGQA